MIGFLWLVCPKWEVGTKIMEIVQYEPSPGHLGQIIGIIIWLPGLLLERAI